MTNFWLSNSKHCKKLGGLDISSVFIWIICLHNCIAYQEDKVDKFFRKFDPYCWIANCDDPTVEAYSPRCWLSGCPERRMDGEEDQRLDIPIRAKFEENEKKKDDSSFFGRFGNNLRSGINQGMNRLKNYLNAAKFQNVVTDQLFSAELSPYCWFSECCNANAIPVNTTALTMYLEDYVYGQPLIDVVPNAVNAHWNSDVYPSKALVMSFHGGVGIGKNYVAQFLAKSLYKLGAKSDHVHHFSGRTHFTLHGDKDRYQSNLYHWLRGNVTACPRQLFIFDEIDKMPDNILNGIKPMLDYRDSVDGVDYRNAIFVFISNIGSLIIENHYTELLDSGKKRNRIQLQDFEKLIAQGALIQKGGLYHSDAITNNLIDHYIPFLPLEMEHVISCIMDEFKRRNVENPTEEHVELILRRLSWNTKNPVRPISLNGCKNIASQVGVYVEKFYRKAAGSRKEL